MAKRKGASATSCSRARKKVDRDAREVENAQRLDSLPLEVWDKIFDEIDENDLFPLALSCRYFRQKQKELVAQTGQNEPGSGKPRLTMTTNLKRKVRECQPASVKYLRFARKEGVALHNIRDLAAFHGYLPLLQPLAKSLRKANSLGDIAEYAGKSHYHILSIIIVFLLFVSASDFFFSLLRSARRSTGDLAVAENPGAVQAG